MTSSTTNRTTIAHILIERLRLSGTNLYFPDKLDGDLIAEHDWAILDPEGPQIMKNYRELFTNICQEIDYAVQEGVVYFDEQDGSIYIQDKHLL